MNIFTWLERLAGDPRSLALSTADREGASWVYCEARSARACASLLAYLKQHGARSVARKGRTALWLEPEA